MNGPFRLFAFAAIILVFIMIGLWSVNRGAASPDAAEESEIVEESPRLLSMEKFLGLETGMDYEQVVAFIGAEGSLFQEIGGGPDGSEPGKQTVYTWTDKDAGRLTAIFVDGILVSKEQYRLQ